LGAAGGASTARAAWSSRSSTTGGARHWARELGVPGRQPARWTHELIETELRLLCAGKE
jgi:hypothetical protein